MLKMLKAQNKVKLQPEVAEASDDDASDVEDEEGQEADEEEVEDLDTDSFDTDDDDEVELEKEDEPEDNVVEDPSEEAEVSGKEHKPDEEDGVRSGWADAMAKVLNTGKTSKASATLLSKAKKDHQKSGTADGQPAVVEKRESYAVKRARKKEKDTVARTKPDVAKDRAKERLLSKLATRGVVQLFNAVREQQKSIKSQLNVAGSSARKREKVFKNIDKEGFLEVLTGGNKRSKESVPTTTGVKKGKMENQVKDEEDESTWKILRDDFMMGAKMKDWDKNSESDE